LKVLVFQTVKPLEIIIANNNSTDATEDIAKKHGCRVLPVSTQGYVYALSEGMNSAKGDVVAIR